MAKEENFSTDDVEVKDEGVAGADNSAEASAEEVTAEENADAAATEEASNENTDGSDVEDAAEAGDSDKKSKKFKKEKKDKKDEQIAALQDQVMRQMAEFQNFRNRTDKEKSQMYDMGAKAIIEKFLPVMDNFERGLAGINEGDDAFSDGMLMIYRQMLAQLKEVGVEPIEAVGQEFNADLHNAVMQTASDEYESGIVAQELQKGYTYKDQVVRHSMVAVVE